METIKTTSVSAHDTYSCTRPKNIDMMDCCKTCTSRQPNINCEDLRNNPNRGYVKIIAKVEE